MCERKRSHFSPAQQWTQGKRLPSKFQEEKDILGEKSSQIYERLNDPVKKTEKWEMIPWWWSWRIKIIITITMLNFNDTIHCCWLSHTQETTSWRTKHIAHTTKTQIWQRKPSVWLERKTESEFCKFGHPLQQPLELTHTSDVHQHTSLIDNNNKTTWTSVGDDDDDLLWPLKYCLNISSLLCLLWSPISQEIIGLFVTTPK